MRSRTLVCVLLSACIAAQQQPRPSTPQPVAQSVASFRSNTQLVLEAVTVKDGKGRPIEGLAARDFNVTEDGQPQTIAFCEFQALDDLESKAGVASTNPRSAEAASTTTGTLLAPNGAIRHPDRRLLALYFDPKAMSDAEKFRSIAAARRFIRELKTESDLLAVMAFSNGAMHLVSDFTADRDSLLKSVGSLANIGESDFEAGAFGQDDDEFNLFTTDRQLAALQTAVSMLGRSAEKKALIYFASGVPYDVMQNQARLGAVTNAALRANVALYPVDARGLLAQPPMGDATKPSPGGIGMYNGAQALAQTAAFERSQDSFYALASDTGGKALLDSNDLSAGIVMAQRDYSSYYLVGYYPTNTALDGKYRRITITLRDSISARLQYRRGYVAGKMFAKFTAEDKERQLEEALMLPDPVTDLTIAMEVNYFQINRAEYYVPVMIKIPGSELVLARHAGAAHTVIDFIGEIKDDANQTIRNLRDKVDMKLTGATAALLSKTPIEYDCGYTLLPGTYSIKVLARDAETGRMGTYLSKFTIPNLNKENKAIAISSVVLGSQRTELRDAVYTAGKDVEQLANPLVQDGHKLIPSVSRVFRQSANLYVYLQAYQQFALAPQPIVAFITFYQRGTKLFETPPVEFIGASDDRLHATGLKFAVPLEKLTPGRYDLQISVIDWASQKTAFWRSPIHLLP